MPETYPIAHLKLFLIQVGSALSIQVVTPVTHPELESSVAVLLETVVPVDVVDEQDEDDPELDKASAANAICLFLSELSLLELNRPQLRNEIMKRAEILILAVIKEFS